jgi:polar amino acid transport system substrate-binding protein
MKFKTLVKSSLAVSFLFLVNALNSAEKITVAFGEVLAPWVLADTNQGIVVEVFAAAMTPLGYEIEYLYLPYGRRSIAYQAGDADVSSDMNLNTINQYNL